MRSSNGLLSGIGAPTPVKIDNGSTIKIPASSTLAFDINGFGGATFVPADMIAPSGIFVRYLKMSGDQLEIARQDEFPIPSVTLGFLADDLLCFFSAGLPSSVLPTSGKADYFGYADGLRQFGSSTQRLFASQALAQVDYGARTGTLQIALEGLPNPFSELKNQIPNQIGTATANFTISGTGIGVTQLKGLPGFTGTFTGSFAGPSGLILTFELHNAAGEVIWGAVALDAKFNGI
jgi:hypothetical protein